MQSDSLTDIYTGMSGFVEIKVIDPNGKVVDVICTPNIITYTATDIIARSLGGDQVYSPTHIWVGGADFLDVPAPLPSVARTDTSLNTVTDPLAVASAVRRELPIVSRGFSPSPTGSNPSPEQQTSNVVTFQAILPATPEDGLPSVDGKYFFEAGIITKLGSTNLLFSHQFHEDIQKLNGFQLVYTWSIRFV